MERAQLRSLPYLGMTDKLEINPVKSASVYKSTLLGRKPPIRQLRIGIADIHFTDELTS
jgi:hypothetical protein